MIYESAGRLVSLAHPLIVSPDAGVWQRKKPLRRLPFPLINLNLEGFTLAHLHWIGINVTDPRRRKPLIQLARLHEGCHRELARTPFSLYVKELILSLYRKLRYTFEEGRERIAVPLSAAKAGNDLKEHWQNILRCHQSSSLVEEIFAVRSSLLEATKLDFIKDDQAQEILTLYKREYGKYIPYFAEIYDSFDLTARKIGESASTTLVFTVLEAFNPSLPFLDFIFRVCNIETLQWKLSHKETNYIINRSSEESNQFFRNIMDYLDQNGTRYHRKHVVNAVEERQLHWWDEIQDCLDGLDGEADIPVAVKILFTSPTTFLFSEYNDIMHTFTKVEGSEEVGYGDFCIFQEAILQQLATGKGLLCPFWRESSPSCCDDTNRALLEQVWSCTSHNRSLNWKRRGCLAEGGEAH